MVARARASLRGLRTFCVAARHESFRLAAEELFITSSAVSHQVKSLEELMAEAGEEVSAELAKAVSEGVIKPLLAEQAAGAQTSRGKVVICAVQGDLHDIGKNMVALMLEVNGFLMDIRSAPRELQEVAFEKGLIPYIPADRAAIGEEA